MNTIEPSTVFILKEMVTYADDSVVSKTLTKNKNGNMTLFAFDKGQGLTEHTSPYNALVIIVDGNCRITIGGKSYEVEEGKMILLPATVPHALDALSRFKMMLIMIKESV